jgi:transcriptional regulator with XRE-family HTH domain
MFQFLSIPKHNNIIHQGGYMNERELLKILGTNIKMHRAYYRWSQADLAERVNISINFLSDIETGKKWPSPNTMVKFADAFSIAAYELLKPPQLLPDNPTNLIYRYTEDVFIAVNKVLDVYMDKLNSPPS